MSSNAKKKTTLTIKIKAILGNLLSPILNEFSTTTAQAWPMNKHQSSYTHPLVHKNTHHLTHVCILTDLSSEWSDAAHNMIYADSSDKLPRQEKLENYHIFNAGSVGQTEIYEQK